MTQDLKREVLFKAFCIKVLRGIFIGKTSILKRRRPLRGTFSHIFPEFKIEMVLYCRQIFTLLDFSDYFFGFSHIFHLISSHLFILGSYDLETLPAKKVFNISPRFSTNLV